MSFKKRVFEPSVNSHEFKGGPLFENTHWTQPCYLFILYLGLRLDPSSSSQTVPPSHLPTSRSHLVLTLVHRPRSLPVSSKSCTTDLTLILSLSSVSPRQDVTQTHTEVSLPLTLLGSVNDVQPNTSGVTLFSFCSCSRLPSVCIDVCLLVYETHRLDVSRRMLFRPVDKFSFTSTTGSLPLCILYVRLSVFLTLFVFDDVSRTLCKF